MVKKEVTFKVGRPAIILTLFMLLIKFYIHHELSWWIVLSPILLIVGITIFLFVIMNILIYKFGKPFKDDKNEE